MCLREEEERPVTPPLVLLAPLTGGQALFRSPSFSQGSYCGIGHQGILAHCWHLVLSGFVDGHQKKVRFEYTSC